MGAWGVGSFENDDALDWIDDFADAPGVPAVEEALTIVAEMNEDEYLEVTEDGAALAAGEVVAALFGKPVDSLPEEVARWADMQNSKANVRLIPMALRAVARVKSKSELNDNWIKDSDRQDWLKAVADLETRLKQAAA